MAKANCDDCGRPIEVAFMPWEFSSHSLAAWVCPKCADKREQTERKRVAGLHRKNPTRKVKNRCSYCDGKGKVKGYKCMACDGAGRIETTKGGPSSEELKGLPYRVGKPI